MDILLGTTNPSKINRFKGFLEGYDVRFFTPADLGITAVPEETGNDPRENAVLKARFYSRYFDTVICNDSGLYLDPLPLGDPRQPGLNIRTPGGGPRLDDEEMIRYYSDLVRSLGGRVLAYYLDGLAVSRRGRIHSYMASPETVRDHSFYLVDTPSPARQPGWPLDSLSQNRKDLTFFSEGRNQQLEQEKETTIPPYRMEVISFLTRALDLAP